MVSTNFMVKIVEIYSFINQIIRITIKLLHCKKNHIFFFQMFWKGGLSKKLALEYDLSCIIRKDDISFPRKYDIIL